MAASCAQNCSRIRIESVIISKSKCQQIPPFWYLINHDTYPNIADVEERLASIMNSYIETNYAHKGTKQKFISSCQLWMSGFLLLSEELSNIFHNDDLVTLECKWEYKTFLDGDSHTNIANVQRKRKNDSSTDTEMHSRKHIKTSASKSSALSTGNQIETDNSHYSATTSNESVKDMSAIENISGEKNQQDMDLLLSLMEKKKTELRQSIDSTQQPVTKETIVPEETQEASSSQKPKRKRRRKHKSKKDANGSKGNESLVDLKNIKQDAKQSRPLSFKMPDGLESLNTRLTFQSDSESDGKPDMPDIGIDNSHNNPANGVSDSFVQSLGVSGRLQNGPSRTRQNMVEKSVERHRPSDRDGSNLSQTDHSHPPFAQGHNIDTSLKFDELKQRRKLKSNNCFVSFLCNGGQVFTRERPSKRDPESNTSNMNGQSNTSSLNGQSLIATKSAKSSSSLNHKSQIPMESYAPLRDSSSQPDQYLLSSENGKSDTNAANSFAGQNQHISSIEKIEVTPLYLDVERCGPLKGTPECGDIIAYKVLELSNDYCPVLSDFKQGQVLSTNGGTIQLELFENSVLKRKTGRFELVYDVKEEEFDDKLVSVELAEMVDPRLVQRNKDKAD